jgi:Ni/Fe-hydrogenase subunit HybB-like protein/cytochrome c553
LGGSSAGAPSAAAPNPSGPTAAAPAAAPAAKAASSPPAAGNPYQALCAGCHGVAGAGGTGPALAGRNLSFDTIQAVVRSGRGIMPAYSIAMAPDADLHTIATFLSQSNGSTGKPLGRPGPSAVLSHHLVSPDGSDTGIVRSPAFPGYIYPNEARLVWSILIVVYPFVTGLVAGAFILASLLSVFKVKAIQPTYRLALLTSMAFLLVATLPLLAHLGHPERSYEIFTTPHTSSAMAMFGFVYAWYLMVVLCLEIWFEYRADMVRWANESTGVKRLFYRLATFFDDDLSPRSVRMDHKIAYVITLLGIPSAFLLHGYVGFIFGSVKANPYWASPLMPVVFLMSAIVSGIALVLLIYTVTCHLRWEKANIVCLDAVGRYLLYALIVDFAMESLDVIHRTYVAEESLNIITLMIKGKLFLTLIVLQVIVGSLIPMASLASTIMFRISERARRWLYLIVSILVLQGIFFMRWNVVIGGQLFSKSLIGFTTYKLESAGREGAMVAMAIMALPLVILAVLTAVLPPWDGVHSDEPSSNGHNPSSNGHSHPGLQSRSDEPEA